MKPFLWLVFAAGVGGCATPARPLAPTSEPSVLPQHVVATAKTVLRVAEDPKVRVAFPRFKLPLRVRTESNGLFAEIDGAMRVSGTVKLAELGVVVCEPGPLGSQFYAGNGNVLTLRSAVRNGRVSVAGEVTVRVKAYAENVPLREQFRLMPFETELDAARLCVAPLPKRHAGTNEDPEVLHGVSEPDVEDFPAGTQMVDIEKNAPLALLDAPGGKPLHTFPATKWGSSLVRLRSEGDWDFVAAGGGPYLLGWIPTRSPRKVEPMDLLGSGGLGLRGQGSVPLALQNNKLASLPLHELPADTEVQQLGVVRARLKKSGYCRIVGEPQGIWSYVIAAVDNDVAVEGWVETAKLGPLVPSKKGAQFRG